MENHAEAVIFIYRNLGFDAGMQGVGAYPYPDDERDSIRKGKSYVRRRDIGIDASRDIYSHTSVDDYRLNVESD